MLTPKIRKTNLVKDNTGFKVGGYARSRAFGTRVYKVLDIKNEEMTVMYRVFTEYGKEPALRYEEKMVQTLTLSKIGETNKGNFKFTNSRPFQVHNKPGGGTMHWYYPAKGI